jgi:hypothetical protein
MLSSLARVVVASLAWSCPCIAGLVGWAHTVCGGALSSVGAARLWAGVIVHVVGVVVKGVQMEVVGALCPWVCFCVVCHRGHRRLSCGVMLVGWAGLGWVGMEGTHLDDDDDNLSLCTIVVPCIL